MEEQFLPFELSIKLEELGFKENVLATYFKDGYFLHIPYDISLDKLKNVRAPLWQQAFDWFENNHNLEGNIKSWREGENKYYYYSVNELYRPSTYRLKFDTKDEARLECLKKLIELVENENSSN